MKPVKKRALYAADREETCEILTALLALRGVEVVTAPSLLTALLTARGQVFNLYVLDAEFWGGAGVRLCRSIREFDPLTPILLLSSAARGGACREALEAGATHCVFKSDVTGLVEALSRVTSAAVRDDSPATSARR